MNPIRLLLAGGLALGVGTPVLAGGNINIVFGPRLTSSEIWEGVDGDIGGGIEFDFGGKEWPVHLAFGIWTFGDEALNGCVGGSYFQTCSYDEDVVDRLVEEWSVGILKVWTPSKRFEIHTGAGVALVSATVEDEFTGIAARDTSEGFYGTLSLLFLPKWGEGESLRFNFGINGRILAGTELEFFNQAADADYHQFGIILGLGW
jgi:hypothetical protein